MLLSTAALAALSLLSPLAAATRSSKRGLVYTPNDAWPQDNSIWVQGGSDLTWYYNYKPSPSAVFSATPQSQFEFVPMLWGAPANLDDTTFLNTVKGLIKSGVNISHVLTFNEPDGPNYTGGSDITPASAARVWVNNIIPLQQLGGIRIGLPGCTGGQSGIPWLKTFLSECSKLISTGGVTKNCTYDFVPLHWYGNFEGLASHMGEYSATFPNTSMWITEYNLPNSDLSSTQAFFNISAEYYDRLDYVERYSFFGTCRSKVCNIGPNGAMLSNDGKLTDIGSWYLGFGATGVLPTSLASVVTMPQFWIITSAMAVGVVGWLGVF